VTRIGPKIVMAIGMTLIGTGVLWATQVPVHGQYIGNLLGPFAVAGGRDRVRVHSQSRSPALAGVEERPGGAGGPDC